MHSQETPPPKRILYVITDLQVGGVPLHVCRLAAEMHGLGHAVRVVSLAPPGPVSQMIEQTGVEVAGCGARSALSIGALWRLRREIISFQPDLVHSFLFHANIACRLMGALAYVSPQTLICEIQTVEIERPWHLTVDRWTHHLCRLEIGNSPSVIEHLHREAGLPKSKLVRVPGGVDVEKFDNAAALDRAAVGAPEDCRLLVWVGRLDPVKGLDDLLSAMAAVAKKVRTHLALVGDGPERPRLEQTITRLGLTDCVTLLGTRKDVPRILKACDMFVFPSRTEGMPNALLEAMAAGCPIVCTDVAGNRDLISDGDSGVLVAPARPEALAEGILQVLEDTALAKRLGSRARRVAGEMYSHSAMVRRYLQAYGVA